MKKNCNSILAKTVISLVFVVFLVLSASSGGISAEPFKIGIAQIVAHPALDACRDGFMAGMEKAGFVSGVDVIYDLQDAQGEISNAITIAQKFKDDKVDLIMAIATPIVQAAAQVTSEIPIIVGAITDPVAANVAKSWESSGNNITGMADAAPNKTQLELIPRFFPQAKRVGTIYNAGEVNSVVQVELSREICHDLGMELVEATASNSNEVLLAAQSLVGRVDVLYIVTDNVAVSAFSSIVKVSLEEKIPIIVADPTMVPEGALASFGIDYFTLGEKSAEKAVEVLQGKLPTDIPIGRLEQPEDLTFMINIDNAQQLDLEIPEELLAEGDSIVFAGVVWERGN
ncbi:MAG: ABC transporter substrate-binding protein [Candidatus Atribacteria bacterium]|nr:ABC transporter substrate-binding protein [Candidatus Atribacteria bacterium]